MGGCSLLELVYNENLVNKNKQIIKLNYILKVRVFTIISFFKNCNIRSSFNIIFNACFWILFLSVLVCLRN